MNKKNKKEKKEKTKDDSNVDPMVRKKNLKMDSFAL